jgi:predicted ATPase
MFLELTRAEWELVEHSIACRLQTWRHTLEYLKTGNCKGMIEECHQVSEAEWMVEQLESLRRKVAEGGNDHGLGK